MTRDDILKLAHEACILSPEDTGEVWCAGEWQLVEFAELVAAAEREACARACTQVRLDDGEGQHQAWYAAIDACIFAIRERGAP